MQLANEFGGLYIPEYARDYIGNLPGRYTFHDVENIARMQVRQYEESYHNKKSFLVFDTWLIITKVWFRWVFGRVPDWLESEISNHPMDLYLLCKPDLPWVADAVRENGGENRIKLYNEYRQELISYGFLFNEIEGSGDQRLQQAMNAIHGFSKLSTLKV